jgi:hypothetical protein
MLRDRPAKGKTHGPPDFVPDLAQTMRQAAGGISPALMTSNDMQMTRAEKDSVRGCPWAKCMGSYVMAVVKRHE